MMCFVHYISAKRRLKESIKTVYMMGGDEECQPMLLAQRDMIALEVEYYGEECTRFVYKMIVLAISLTLIFILSQHIGVLND